MERGNRGGAGLSMVNGHPRRAHRARVAERAGEVDEDAEDDVVQSVKPSDETGDNEDDAEEEDLAAAEENSSRRDEIGKGSENFDRCPTIWD